MSLQSLINWRIAYDTRFWLKLNIFLTKLWWMSIEICSLSESSCCSPNYSNENWCWCSCRSTLYEVRNFIGAKYSSPSTRVFTAWTILCSAVWTREVELKSSSTSTSMLLFCRWFFDTLRFFAEFAEGGGFLCIIEVLVSFAGLLALEI